ncbi:MAG: DUF3147 family protein [Candidatus Melainabacteria bacterium]
MWLLTLKYALSALMVVLISETARRSGWLGGLVASLPVASLLAMCWLYAETRDRSAVAGFSAAVVWYVLPSLVLFLVLPVLLKTPLSFPLALGVAVLCTLAAYALTFWLLQQGGVRL